MSNTNEKVLSMIASFFSESLEHIVVHHYNLKSFTVVNTVNLFDHIKATLTKDKIPFRGKVSGFKTLLRKEVLHLLNIDGDTGHHAQNEVMKFKFLFGNTLGSSFLIFVQIYSRVQICNKVLQKFANLEYTLPNNRRYMMMQLSLMHHSFQH